MSSETIIIILTILAVIFAVHGFWGKGAPAKASLLLALISILVSVAIYFSGAEGKTAADNDNLVNVEDSDVGNIETTVDNSITDNSITTEQSTTIVINTSADFDINSLTGLLPPTETTQNQEKTPESTPNSSFIIPANLQSPYGKALKDEFYNGAYYSDKKKADILLETYEARKDENKKNQKWYYSTPIDDEVSGYRLDVYYADNMPFFVNVKQDGTGLVKLYYWGNELVMCYDKRGVEKIESYKGSEIYDAVSQEFSHVYELACKTAQNR